MQKYVDNEHKNRKIDDENKISLKNICTLVYKTLYNFSEKSLSVLTNFQDFKFILRKHYQLWDSWKFTKPELFSYQKIQQMVEINNNNKKQGNSHKFYANFSI